MVILKFGEKNVFIQKGDEIKRFYGTYRTCFDI